MPITNIYFERIEASRKRKIKAKIKANASLTFKDVEESAELDNKKVLLFPFEFSLSYEEEAKINLAGYVVYIEDKKKAEKLKKDWRKNKEFMKQLYNYALLKCNLKALLLEDQLGLPLHLPMPRIK